MARRRYYMQEQQNTCGVASLRTVLALQFGVTVESEQVLEVLGTNAHDPIRTNGTDTLKLRDMIKGASFAFNKGREWTLKVRLLGTMAQLKAELRRGRNPLVRIYERVANPDYHMIVVLAFDGDRVRLWNPDTSSKRPVWRSARWFLSVWRDPHNDATWYGVVNANDSPTARGTRCAPYCLHS